MPYAITRGRRVVAAETFAALEAPSRIGMYSSVVPQPQGPAPSSSVPSGPCGDWDDRLWPGWLELRIRRGGGFRGLRVLRCTAEASPQIRVEEACHIPGLLQVAGGAPLDEFGHVRLEDAEGVPLDQDARKVATREAHHGVVPAIGEQLGLYSFHRSPRLSFRLVQRGSQPSRAGPSQDQLSC